MKISSSYRSLMVLSVIFTLVFASAWQYIVYKSYSMKSDIAMIASQAQESTARGAYLLSLKGTLTDLKGDLAQIDNRFVTRDGIPGVIDDIEARAQQMGVKVDVGSVNLEEATDPTAPHALKLHVSGSGSWRGDMSFISTVESLPYTAKVENLDMAVSARVWSFNTDLIIYVVN
jgi:Tfp pilus assembly protein PilO